MSVSIIIVSFQTREVLLRCLASLPKDAEVVVVDNASQDDSVAAVRAHFPQVRVLQLDRNLGFGAAVNRGAAAVSGVNLLLLNPDTEFIEPDTLTRMSAALASAGEQVFAVGFRQVDAAGFYQLAVGPRPSLWAEWLRRFVQRRLDRRNRWVAAILDWWFRRSRNVPWVSGSALLVRRQAFAQVGGFDERFFLYFEDIDFCLRLGAAGGRVIYDPSVTVLHHRGLSARTASVAAHQAYRQSQLYYWEKYRGPRVRRLVARYQRWRGLA